MKLFLLENKELLILQTNTGLVNFMGLKKMPCKDGHFKTTLIFLWSILINFKMTF